MARLDMPVLIQDKGMVIVGGRYKAGPQYWLRSHTSIDVVDIAHLLPGGRFFFQGLPVPTLGGSKPIARMATAGRNGRVVC